MDHHHHHQKMRDKVVEDHQQSQQQQPLPSTTTTTASRPSSSSSPNHEFSFTISLHHQPPSTTTMTVPGKAKSLPSIAVDLSPADEIFFHGHLLPLHLSHLPVSPPRSSANSLDSFTLPIRELLEDQNNHNNNDNNNSSKTKERPKSKSFSLFGRSRKGFEDREREEKQKRKLRFNVSHVLKRYMRMVGPLLSFRGWRRENIQLGRQRPTYTFSGNLSPRRGGRRGELSAPASMRTSPTNSGLLLATGAVLPTCKSDSTMEELQAAIQAAIAHCKNSIAMEDKIKS